GTLLNNVTLGAGDRIPTEINFTIVIAGRGSEAFRRRWNICRRDRRRPNVEAGAKYQLLIVTGDAFNVRRCLGEQPIDRILFGILDTGLFLAELAHTVHFT